MVTNDLVYPFREKSLEEKLPEKILNLNTGADSLLGKLPSDI